MKLRSYFTLALLLSCIAPTLVTCATEESAEYRYSAGSLIEAKSLKDLQSIIASNENVVVDFYATWCSPCKRMGPEFAKLPQAFQSTNIIFVKINVDLVGNEYGIKSLPTIACFIKQKEVSRSLGFKPFNDLSNYVKSVYPA